MPVWLLISSAALAVPGALLALRDLARGPRPGASVYVLWPVSMTVDESRATVRLSRGALARMDEGAPLYLERRQASRLGMSRELVVRLSDD